MNPTHCESISVAWAIALIEINRMISDDKCFVKKFNEYCINTTEASFVKNTFKIINSFDKAEIIEVKLFACCLLLVSFCSLLVSFCSLLVSFCSLLVSFCSLLVSFCSLLFARCSLVFARCSLLFTRCSFLTSNEQKVQPQAIEQIV